MGCGIQVNVKALGIGYGTQVSIITWDMDYDTQMTFRPGVH